MTVPGPLTFPDLSQHHTSLVAPDSTGACFLKIETARHAHKSNALEEEAAIMRRLNDAGCLTCPQVIQTGTFKRDEVLRALGERGETILGESPRAAFPFLVTQFVPRDETIRLADLLLAMIEQKALGVYHGDPKPANCRFDIGKGLLYMIDYDQAVILDDSVRQLDNLSFLDWCAMEARRKYGADGVFHYFEGLDFDRHVRPLFRGGALNLGQTSLFRMQKTTLSAGGIYHRIAERDVFADGERGVDDRMPTLERLTFHQGERILDVGCNTGLLSRYLFDRGCAVTGIELDPHALAAARIISNIVGKHIDFRCLDLDNWDIAEDFDTIMLFSVLHHTQNIAQNGAKLAARCRRIVIECRLVEGGAKPIGDAWYKTGEWQFASLDELASFLTRLFPNFRFASNLGQGDRGRFILEFVRI